MKKIHGKITTLSNIKGEITYGNGQGVTDYEKLNNKPSIESVELIGNKNFEDLGLSPIDTDDIIGILI